MKWLATLPYVRRLIGKPGGVPLRDARIGPLTLLGPLGDFLAYCVLIAAGASSARSQSISFLIATALYYLPYRGAGARTSGGSLRLQLAVVILTAFVLRGGVFALLTSRWGWPGHAAMLLAVATTGAVLRPGYAYCISSTARTFGSDATWRLGALGLVVFALALRLIYSGQVELLPGGNVLLELFAAISLSATSIIRRWSAGSSAREPPRSAIPSSGCASARCAAGAVAALFVYRLTRNLFGEASALVARAPGADAAVLLSRRDAHDARRAADGRVGGGAVFPGARPDRRAQRRRGGEPACVWVLGLLSKYTIGLLGLSTVHFHAARFALAPLVSALGTVWRGVLLALAVFSPVIIWNYQQRLGFLRVSNFPPAGRIARSSRCISSLPARWCC